MAVIKATAKLEVTTTVTLSEKELRGLSKLSAYSIQDFLKNFEKLGTLSDEEKQGIHDLFTTVRESTQGVLSRATKARKNFYGEE